MANQKFDETIKQAFRPDQPLGPIASVDTIGDSSSALFRAYFDAENYPMKRLNDTNPVMIVGRKGAGKTDALLSAQLSDEFSPIVYFNYSDAAKSFTNILSQIEQAIHMSRISPMVESVADFWESLFWISIASTIINQSDNKSAAYERIKSAVSELGIKREDISTNNPYVFILRAVICFREIYEESDFPKKGVDFFNSYKQLRFGDITDAKIREYCLEYLIEKDTHAIVLFDSFEAIDVTDPSCRLALSALMKCAGDFHKPGVACHMRCCIPAETYFFLQDISSNNLKDFQRTLILHWHAGELLKLAARRYATFIRIWEPDSYKRVVDSIDLSSRSGAIDFWKQFLPDEIVNTCNGVSEDPIPYILRHTQLLPRQLLLLLNGIIAKNISDNGQYTGKISKEIVSDVINYLDSQIISQIIGSYSNIWDDAEPLLEASLPSFREYGGNIILYDDVHKIFNKIPKVFGNRRYLFRDYIRMLAELGVIGRLIQRTDRFAVAVFEYAEPSKLLLTPGDWLCVHPVFTEKFRAVDRDTPPPKFLPVYPLGFDPLGSDPRPTQEWF